MTRTFLLMAVMAAGLLHAGLPRTSLVCSYNETDQAEQGEAGWGQEPWGYTYNTTDQGEDQQAYGNPDFLPTPEVDEPQPNVRHRWSEANSTD
jgi:hypothetical protein